MSSLTEINLPTEDRDTNIKAATHMKVVELISEPVIEFKLYNEEDEIGYIRISKNNVKFLNSFLFSSLKSF